MSLLRGEAHADWIAIIPGPEPRPLRRSQAASKRPLIRYRHTVEGCWRAERETERPGFPTARPKYAQCLVDASDLEPDVDMRRYTTDWSVAMAVKKHVSVHLAVVQVGVIHQTGRLGGAAIDGC